MWNCTYQLNKTACWHIQDGTSQANICKNQEKLHSAAAGSAKITGFFTSIPKPTKQPVNVQY